MRFSHYQLQTANISCKLPHADQLEVLEPREARHPRATRLLPDQVVASVQHLAWPDGRRPLEGQLADAALEGT